MAGNDFVLGTIREGEAYRGSVGREDGAYIALRNGAIGREFFTPMLFVNERDALAAAAVLAEVLAAEG